MPATPDIPLMRIFEALRQLSERPAEDRLSTPLTPTEALAIDALVSALLTAHAMRTMPAFANALLHADEYLAAWRSGAAFLDGAR